MPEYMCERCHQQFPKKYNLDKHLKRKTRCHPSIIDPNCDDSETFLILPEKFRENQEKSGFSGFSGKIRQNQDNSHDFWIQTYPESPRILHNRRTFDQKPKFQNVMITNTKVQSKKGDRVHNESQKKHFCEFCSRGFTRRDNMLVHQRGSCRGRQRNHLPLHRSQAQRSRSPSPRRPTTHEENLQAKVERLEQQIAELRENPRTTTNVINNRNILQVVCIGNNDNYLDMLTEEVGFDNALRFIKNCALSDVNGDCKLIEKIYLNDRTNPSIRYVDKKRTKIEYFIENIQAHEKESVIDHKGIQLGKKLANNLQNSYLKGVNHLINQNLKKKLCPNKFLSDFDLCAWNKHIYDLCDDKYHKKIVKQLNIPLGDN